ncbi:hypothetical protein MRB53_037740 [Persea americana]|nr:hypothetical protein MRB53_037740 [Persea americana]
MPDNVRTGFISASKLGSDDDHDGEDGPETHSAAVSRKPKAGKGVTVKVTGGKAKQPSAPPKPNIAPIPFLEDVVLTKDQHDNLMRNYASAAVGDDPSDHIVHAPDPTRYPEKFRNLGKTRFIGHGQFARRIERTMQVVHSIDDAQIERMKALVNMDDLTHNAVTVACLAGGTGARTNKERPGVKASVGRTSQPDAAHRRATIASPRLSDCTDSETELPAVPRAARARAAPKKHQSTHVPRPKTSTTHVLAQGSSAAEADASSPEPTPADLRIPTQGIDLGSRDTSGEDNEDEEEPDSELAAFIAASSDAIELMTSSQHALSSSRAPSKRTRKRLRVGRGQMRRPIISPIQSSSDADADQDCGGDGDSDGKGSIGDELSIIGDSDESMMDSPRRHALHTKPRGKAQKRAIVDDDSDE